MSNRVHIGCGPNHMDGWLNLDCDPASKADRLVDCTDLANIALRRPIDLIYSAAFIEHLPYYRIPDHLASCHEALEPGGKLLGMDIPNAAAIVCMSQVDDCFTFEQVNRFLLCEQDAPHQRHKALLTPKTAYALLHAAGFDKIAVFTFCKPWEDPGSLWFGFAAGKETWARPEDVLDIYPRAAEIERVCRVI